MQYKVPRIPSFAGLTGLDLRIQQIQTSLASSLSFLQYSFGLCYANTKQDGENVIVIPVCYVDDHSDPLDMRPFLDDAHESYSFWDMVDPMVPEYSDNLGARRSPALIYDVACIFVIDLDSINTNSKVARSSARQDILKFFNQNIRFSGTFQIGEMRERNIEDIFTGYDITDPQIILKDNVAAFRVEGTITFKQDC